jgi:hydrogenase maturation protease
MAPRVLVAGIGNVFLGDDAFGVEVVRLLLDQNWPDGVSIRDFGIRGFDLALALMEPWRRVIVVDAYAHGGPPGSLYVIEPDLPSSHEDGNSSASFDGHSLHPLAVLHLVQRMGGNVPPIMIVGCEPADVSEQAGMELTPHVKAALNEAVVVIERLVHAVVSSPACDLELERVPVK